MLQPTLFSSPTWTVSDLTRHIRERLDSDVLLQDLWIDGEVSNLSRPASGHLYFTLKDAGASLRCVMWRPDARRIGDALRDGQAVEAHGRISVYEAGGQYQLYVDDVRPVGQGALFQEFLRLKAALAAEGLFDADRKRGVPRLPRRIGVVTSRTGAALRDILNTLQRRMPLAEVVVVPSPVQGPEAAGALADALQALESLAPDVILLVRGGGSIEDLWAFNDPALVRAVAASRVPVICGVGHETDFTLCDFAADVRAPTPTGAAELATPVTRHDLAEALRLHRARLVTAAGTALDRARDALAAGSSHLRFVSPSRRLQTERQRIDQTDHRLAVALAQAFRLRSASLQAMTQRMVALNPAAVLERGFAIVSRLPDGRIVTRRADASELMQVRVSDGAFRVRKD